MNSLQLAPFNESMRLGQGYNSFLQRPCVYGAFQDPKALVQNNTGTVPSRKPTVPNRYASLQDKGSSQKSATKNGVPQVVSYSSRVVSRVSEVTRSMNISAGASIRSGSVTILGNQSAIDETKLSTSDLNVIISVKVVNQTTNIDSANKFHVIDKVTQENFHHVYGDSYISGFIDGGEFHSLVSIRVLDSTRKEEIVSSLKERLNGADPKAFATSTASTTQMFSTELSQTETSIFVNWSGGGQIKPADEQWTLDSIFRAAAAFPDKVAQYPQRCWAILTQYPKNFSFLDSTLKAISVRNFANVQQYAADLLDDFMGHKTNLGIIESVLDEPTEYGVGPGENPVDVRAQDLVRNRAQIKAEMEKIVKVIEALDKDPVEGMKNKPSNIDPPELWAIRLPVRRTAFEADHAELPPISEGISNALEGFNFVWADSEKERMDLVERLKNPPPPSKSSAPVRPLPAITTIKAREGMTKEDLEFVDSPENRRKFAGLLLDQSCGMPDRKINFNDAVDIAKDSLTATWPTILELGLVNWEGKEVLGYYQLDYSETTPKNLRHGSTGKPLDDTEDRRGKITIDLNPQEKDRIIGVTMALASENGKTCGIKFIQVHVKDGPQKALGQKTKDDVVVECSAPEGFGLKGFYGHAQGDEVIVRIGAIWGK